MDYQDPRAELKRLAEEHANRADDCGRLARAALEALAASVPAQPVAFAAQFNLDEFAAGSVGCLYAYANPSGQYTVPLYAPVSQEVAPAVMNQCDGCCSGQRLDGSMHRDASGRATMVCQADRYAAQAVAQPVAPAGALMKLADDYAMAWHSQRDGERHMNCVEDDEWVREAVAKKTAECAAARAALERALAAAPTLPQAAAQEAPAKVARADDFLHGICVALSVITAHDDGVVWAEIVRTAGEDEMLRYAAHIEPEEWDLAGFAKYARIELKRNRPRALASTMTEEKR